MDDPVIVSIAQKASPLSSTSPTNHFEHELPLAWQPRSSPDTHPMVSSTRVGFVLRHLFLPTRLLPTPQVFRLILHSPFSVIRYYRYVPLPKSSTPARIRSNTNVYDFSLDEEDMQRLDSLDKGDGGAISWNPIHAA